MAWSLWIVLGFVAGWLTARRLEEGYGRFMDIAMGIGDAVVGGFLMPSAGIPAPAERYSRASQPLLARWS